ncbi:cystinosin homolog [Anopheles ziemanni]|uniref:cystinosin homolog n=1 Tax=Anopheles coustani TaxID=139045 RepID=UPI00265A6CE8|nr:cystinosin homolog [Anopheles coustani]XP_058168964.1 cystinosin homolog [Anopheles ziemanni]
MHLQCLVIVLSVYLGINDATTGLGNQRLNSLSLKIEPQAITTSLEEPAHFWLVANGFLSTDTNVTITWEWNEAIEILPESITISPSNRTLPFEEWFPVQATSTLQGRFLIRPLVLPPALVDESRLFAQLKVAKYQPLIILSMLIGWTYTVCWTIGDYFQAWTSYKRKSVVGLSFDFLCLNVVGNCCYATFNVLLFCNSHIESEYFNRNPFGLNPVIANDVAYAVHAVFGNVVLIVQCYIYQSNGNVVSLPVKMFMTGCVVLVAVFCALTLAGQLHWLDFLYMLSYVKLSTNLVKYIPQVFMNYRRKSTEGFAISNRLLDLAGGLLSLLQMILNGWNFDDWQSILGSPNEYYRRHQFGLNPVIGNDIGFAMHAVFGTGFTILQCRMYDTGGNSVSTPAKAIISVYMMIITITFSAAALRLMHWLDFLYIMSYIKLSTTMIKYFPQAYMNYRRKSTEGFEILNRLLDLAGGLFGILQMVINAWNFDDWRSIGGDPVKFGLGIFSILFDLVFMFQHYILYRKRKPAKPVEYPLYEQSFKM